MTCQNCDSTDIVKIQGDQFCMNCGQNLAQQAVKKIAADKVPAPEVPDTHKVAVTPGKPTKPIITMPDDIEAKPAEEERPRPSVRTSSGKTKVNVSKPKRATAAISKFNDAPTKPVAPVAPPRRLSDLAPGVKSGIAGGIVISSPVSPPPKPATTYEKPAKVEPREETKAETNPQTIISSDFDYSLSASFETIGSKGARHYGLAFGVVAGIPLAAIFGWLSRTAEPGDTITFGAGWSLITREYFAAWAWLGQHRLFATLITAGLSLYVFLFLTMKLRALAAISYGKAKQLDRRSVDYHEWVKAARGSEASLLWLTVFDLVFSIAAFTAAALAWQVSEPALTNNYLRWTAAGVLTVLAIGVSLYAILLSLVALPAVVLTGKSAASALELAGKLTSGRRFQLGLRLVISLLAVSVVLVAAVALVAAVGVLTVPFLPPLARGIATALVGLLAGMAAGNAACAIVADTWTGRYHILARIRGAESASSLLAGRDMSNITSRSYVMLLLSFVVISLVAAAVVYIWFGDLHAWGHALVDFWSLR